MKFSCLKNDLKNGLKLIDKFAGVFKKESLVLKICVEESVRLSVATPGYEAQVSLPQVEIQESGLIGVDYSAFQQVLKGLRRNVLLSCRLVTTPEGVAFVLVTPEGEVHRIPAQMIQPEAPGEEAQPVMNLGMDEFWQSLLQVNRIVPKKHLIDVFTKVKWVVTPSAVRWVAVSQTELAIKHFQTLVSEGSQVFYLKGSDMDILKKCLSAVSDQRLLVESTSEALKLSGETFVLMLPLERGVDVQVEKLVVRNMVKYEVSIPNWMEQVHQQVEILGQQDAAITAKQLKCRLQVEDQQLQLVLAVEEDGRGWFGADEFLKMFKQDSEGAWQCWIPQGEEPMIAFVKQESMATFYLYLLTTGLV